MQEPINSTFDYRLTMLTNGYILFYFLLLLQIKMYVTHTGNNLVHMSVRTKDGSDLGKVIAVDNRDITVGGKKTFKFPIELIEQFKKNNVFVNINTNEIYRFKIPKN
ncbi:MAG: hypothetical protein MRJ93_07295 [Nitrososphaeraceae archaeon]|nr:hypothetical protein [Nitrososphaeraceae archaeon]